jgi:hypothetical protein
MNTRICSACKGTKLLLYIGGITRACNLCNGIGHVEIPLADEPEPEKEIQMKKRGRPPKQVENISTNNEVANGESRQGQASV